MVFGFGFSATKTKPQLKMAVSRFGIVTNKKSALMKQQMREIAKLLADDPPHEEKAKIRAEALITDDNTIEAHEILQLTCELLSERIKLIASENECPPDLVSSISTLIWAANRVDIPELLEVKKQFHKKYGSTFIENAMNNSGGILNERVVAKLSVQPPTAFLIQTYLEKIADQFEIDWKPTVKLSVNEMSEPMAAPIGYSVQVSQGSGLTHAYAAPATESIATATATSTNTDDIIKDDIKDEMMPPYAASIPVVPVTYMPPTNASVHDNAAAASAPDIYVPPAGKADPNKDSNNNQSSDNNNGNDFNGGGTYEDLEARFKQLKK